MTIRVGLEKARVYPATLALDMGKLCAARHDGCGPAALAPGRRMAGGSVHHLAQQQNRRAERASREPRRGPW